jgi:hypothetical protein
MLSIGIYAGAGANSQPLAEALRGWGFDVRELQLPALEHLESSDLDVLYLPGGWYRFSEETNRALQAWVKAGGGCAGTCAGSYLVAGYIPLIPGRVLRANLRGRLYLEPQREHPILRGVARPCLRHQQRRWEPIAVTHLGGAFLLPENPEHIIASYDYEGEIGALVAAPVGAGRAVAIASHPERELADLPAGDPVRVPGQYEAENLPQGDARRITRNAVLWAAGRDVPAE